MASSSALFWVVLVATCLLIVLSVVSIGGSENSHSHEHDHTKERQSDGAFSPSQQKHFADGVHHTEFDHEAILGSRDVAKEFDSLPAEEAKARLAVVARTMDKNKDGKINQGELKQWILQSFKMLNKEDSEERHEESDSNSDGYVTWDEYVEENYGIGGLDGNPELGLDDMVQEKKMLQEDKELFSVSDLDGDNRLSKAEFLPFSHPEEYPVTRDILLRRTMAERDLDGDGYLTLDEFMGEEARNKDKEWEVLEKDKFTNDFDKDKNGKLSPEEVLLWLAPDDGESADQEAEHLIDSADDDLDGILDIIEIVKHHDIFVGSEATDFGQHLHDPHKFKEEL